MSDNLVYDVGLFDGNDTAYYLFRGYNVVSIDANPLMIERATARFSREIEDGRLTLLNIWVGRSPGTETFWVSDVPEWSSFNRQIASRGGTEHRPIAIPVVQFSQIIDRYGMPHYMKIDIEGNDVICLEDLKPEYCPAYISVESECSGDSGAPTDSESLSMLERLHELGYRRFKLVGQEHLTTIRNNRFAHFSARVINSAAHGTLAVKGISSIAKRLTDAGRTQARLRFRFSFGSSGPWGDDIPGGWVSVKSARRMYLRERARFRLQNGPAYSFWYDWHATH